MSVLVGVRLPELLNKRIEEESVKQGGSKSKTIIALLEKAMLLPSERSAPPAKVVAASIPGVKTAADLPKPAAVMFEGHCPHGRLSQRHCNFVGGGCPPW